MVDYEAKVRLAGNPERRSHSLGLCHWKDETGGWGPELVNVVNVVNVKSEVSQVEVRAEILLRIAREFGRTMEWLLTGEDRP